jgi:hypothetical protein
MGDGSPEGRGSDWAARFLLATRVVDRGYGFFDRLRSEAVLAVASDRTLDRFNDLAYAKADDYDPESAGFRAYLFPWEERVIEQFFPKAPARVLVGGAGGGREAFALLDRGYEVTAFDPSGGLVRAMAGRRASDGRLDLYVGAYEDLPRLQPVAEAGGTVDVASLAPFDASVIGWGSFSHVRTSELRIHTLRSFAAATRGPVVVSFLKMGSLASSRPLVQRIRRTLRQRKGREDGDAFSVHIGYYHVFEDHEVAELARQAGLEVLALNSDARDTNWPYAVMMPRGEPEGREGRLAPRPS